MTTKKKKVKDISSKEQKAVKNLLDGGKKVKDMPLKDQKAVKNLLDEGRYLPFYKSSGTSVFTSRVPLDFKDLLYQPKEWEYYIPQKSIVYSLVEQLIYSIHKKLIILMKKKKKR